MIRVFLKLIGLNSIQGRSTFIAFFFILMTAVVIGMAGFSLTINFESRRFHEHFSLLATYLASNAELGVLLGNEETLRLLSENMLQMSDVRIVEIVDRFDRVLMRRTNLDLPEEYATVSAPVLASSMEQGGLPMFAGEQNEILGTVFLSYSLRGLNEFKELLANRFILVSLFLALVPILMHWLLSRAINVPLSNLLNVAGQVSRGRMNVRAERSSLREIDTLSRAFNEMLDALENQRQELNEANVAMARQQVLAEVGKFSMTIAHEIKNPLAIIKGSLNIFKKKDNVDPKMKQRMMGFIDEEIIRIDKLIEDFLLFARPRPPVYNHLPIVGLVYSLVQRVRLLDTAVDVTTDYSESPQLLGVYCDLPLIERALLNVVRNAVEASAGHGRVRINITCSSEYLQFSVRDHGPGIDPDDLEKIFEPFVTRKSKGTGLGLAIARNTLNAHGGKIVAANCKEGGAVFTLSLPVLSFLEDVSKQDFSNFLGTQCILKENL